MICIAEVGVGFAYSQCSQPVTTIPYMRLIMYINGNDNTVHAAHNVRKHNGKTVGAGLALPAISNNMITF